MVLNIKKNVESKIQEDLSPARNLTGTHLKIVSARSWVNVI